MVLVIPQLWCLDHLRRLPREWETDPYTSIVQCQEANINPARKLYTYAGGHGDPAAPHVYHLQPGYMAAHWPS